MQSTPPIARKDGPAGRFYQIGDQLYPSVTHILSAVSKPALIFWAANEERKLVTDAAADLHAEWCRELVPVQLPRAAYVATLLSRLGPQKAHQRQLAAAGDIGTHTHKLIEWFLRTAIGADAGPEPVVCDAATWGFFAFQDWARSVSFKPVLIEQTVYSQTHGFAGTLDVLARVNGVLTEVSLKTGKAIYGEAHLQSCMYRVALAELGYVVPASVIVRVPKVTTDPAFEVAVVPPVADLWPVCQAVQTLWAWQYKQDEAYRARKKTAAA